MTRSLIRWGLIVIALSATALGGLGLKRYWNSRKPDNPSIVVDPEIDLGFIESGQAATAKLTIQNRGGQPLLITDVRTDCGCLGVVQVLDDGSRKSFLRTEVPPDQAVTVELNFLVRGATGLPIQQHLQFRTNDPKHPDVILRCKATPAGTVVASPATITLGSVQPTEKLTHFVEIRNDRRSGGCEIAKVISSNPDMIKTKYIPARNGEDGNIDSAPLGKYVDRLVVNIEVPIAAKSFAETISIYFTDRAEPVITIPLSGRVTPAIELVPDYFRIPRASSLGPEYTSRAVIRGANGSRLTVTTITTPEELSVSVEPPTEGQYNYIVVVELNPTARGKNISGVKEVIFVVREETKSHTLKLKVQIDQLEEAK